MPVHPEKRKIIRIEGREIILKATLKRTSSVNVMELVLLCTESDTSIIRKTKVEFNSTSN
jgi:hypothetical protein